MIKFSITKKIYFAFWMAIISPVFAFAQATDSITVATYYPAPYGVYNTFSLFPESVAPPCNVSHEGDLFYYSGTPAGPCYCAEDPANPGFYKWFSLGNGGADDHWTLSNPLLYTHDIDIGENWDVAIGYDGPQPPTQPNAKLQVFGAISRGISVGGVVFHNNLYGTGDAPSTQVNLGLDSTTGVSGSLEGYQTVSGGENNTASRVYSTVGGGLNNTASGGSSVVGGGSGNTASGAEAVIAGGRDNVANYTYDFIGGGQNNTTGLTSGGIIFGGSGNTVSGGYVLGGLGNTASLGTIAGGSSNTTNTLFAAVPGGEGNQAMGGEYSFAAGKYANAVDEGSFVWSDSNGSAGNTCDSQGFRTFTVCAQGGVYLKSPTCAPPDCDWAPYDIAEFMDILKQENAQEAELVALKQDSRLGKTSSAYDENLIGVISSKKTTTLHLGNTEARSEDTERKPVALAGPVFVKVNNESGSIKLGDPITSSSTPGVGMKAAQPGKIIGYAMHGEDFSDTDSTEILVFVSIGYYLPEKIYKELEEVEALEKQLKDIKEHLSKLSK